jgi:hypothetical protein
MFTSDENQFRGRGVSDKRKDILTGCVQSVVRIAFTIEAVGMKHAV